MSGRVVRAIPRTVLDYSYLAANTSEERVVVAHIDASQWTSAFAEIRLHGSSFGTNSGGKVEIFLVPDGSTEEDPKYSFISTAGSLGSQVINASTGVGNFLGFAASSNPSAMVAVVIVATQDTSSQLSLMVEISVDIVFKGA